jgi:hypothetical protein
LERVLKTLSIKGRRKALKGVTIMKNRILKNYRKDILWFVLPLNTLFTIFVFFYGDYFEYDNLTAVLLIPIPIALLNACLIAGFFIVLIMGFITIGMLSLILYFWITRTFENAEFVEELKHILNVNSKALTMFALKFLYAVYIIVLCYLLMKGNTIQDFLDYLFEFFLGT